MNGDIIKYVATTATDDTTDMFDQDNFYPMDGEGEYDTAGGGSYDGLGEVYDTDNYGYFSGLDTDGEGLDIEYSEAFGDFVKKVGGLFKKGGMKGAISNRQSGQDQRLEDREKKLSDRTSRRTKRKEAKGRRKNLRQMQTWKTLPPPIQQQAENIVNKSAANGNPKPKTDLDQFKEGEADPNAEQKAMEIIQAANNDVATGNDGMESATFVATDGNLKVGWWEKKKTGTKVAIIGGAVVGLALIVWGIYAATKKRPTNPK
jgi:predicted RNA-binding protein with RPS1 domain